MCEIGTQIAKRGQVKQVKVLGTLALIDEGTDKIDHLKWSSEGVKFRLHVLYLKWSLNLKWSLEGVKFSI